MPERLIDVPIESLPFVDEHSVSVSASAEETWAALLESLGSGFSNTRPGQAAVRRLGCTPSEQQGEPGRIGSTIPGFIVTRAVPPAVLALMGEHRYSRYALVFRLTERSDAPLLLSAETRAEFPGRSGSGLPDARDRQPRPRARHPLAAARDPPRRPQDGPGSAETPGAGSLSAPSVRSSSGWRSRIAADRKARMPMSERDHRSRHDDGDGGSDDAAHGLGDAGHGDRVAQAPGRPGRRAGGASASSAGTMPTAEIASPASGVMRMVTLAAGDPVTIGATLAVVDLRVGSAPGRAFRARIRYRG